VYKGLEDVYLIEQDSRLPQRRRDFSNKAKKERILRGVISMLTFLLTHVVRAMKAVYFLPSGRRSFQVLLMHRADFVPSVLIPVVFHLTDLSRAAPSVAINKSHMLGAAYSTKMKLGRASRKFFKCQRHHSVTNDVDQNLSNTPIPTINY
jgi:hypothetical protein